MNTSLITSTARENNLLLNVVYAGQETPEQIDIAELLIAKGIDINSKGNYGPQAGYNPFTCALQKGYFNLATLLKTKGAKINEKNSQQNNITILASKAHKPEALPLLEEIIATKTEDINFKAGYDKRNALMIAVKYSSVYTGNNQNYLNFINCLIKNDAVINDMDNKGKTALDLATEYKVPSEIIKFLTDNGARTGEQIQNERMAHLKLIEDVLEHADTTDIEVEYRCPITLALMDQPVKCSQITPGNVAQVYEKDEILKYFKEKNDPSRDPYGVPIQLDSENKPILIPAPEYRKEKYQDFLLELYNMAIKEEYIDKSTGQFVESKKEKFKALANTMHELRKDTILKYSGATPTSQQTSASTSSHQSNQTRIT
jgi:hypothetical protein